MKTQGSDPMNPTETNTEHRPVSEWLVRDLVEAHPPVLEILGPLGIDLCCGGGHEVGAALDLHGIEREPVISAIERAMTSETGAGT
jgi:iron-sulfur cluster repair protein YtfE (RIC family)